MNRFAPGTGSGLSATLFPAIERAREWAGEGLRALLLAGSHATGEAVWADVDGRPVSLSDLDLYAVMLDEPACAAARHRAGAGRAAAAHEAPGWGLAAPLEVAFVTLEGLARMPARPGTIELGRSGRVLAGDPGVLARLPRWEPAGVSAEERLLLLENRAFELLGAAGEERGTGAAGPASVSLAALRARHAVLKTALDLAVVRTLGRGELPAGAAARVARARELGVPQGLPSWLERAWDGLEPLWGEALAWRGGTAPAPAAGGPQAEWRAAARAWCAAWWGEREGAHAPRDPWERALQSAARAPLARRLRRSLEPRAGIPDAAEGPGALARLRHAFAGTPQHRIHGSATVLLLAAAQSPASSQEPRLPAGALRALGRLGVTRATEFAAAAAAAVRAWDRELHAGLRTAEPR